MGWKFKQKKSFISQVLDFFFVLFSLKDCLGAPVTAQQLMNLNSNHKDGGFDP